MPSPAAGLRRRSRFNPGDAILYVLTLLAALSGLVLVILIALQVFDDAWPAMQEFGLGFLTSQDWDYNRGLFGAGSLLYGTAITSLIALFLAAPLAIAIALFLTELAPRWLRGPVGTLVELLAAVPTVVLGLWGILVLGPVVNDQFGPVLNGVFGWIPLFGTEPTSGSTVFTAILILTIMIVPIVSSICRELFLAVPRDLKEGALALGTTRWEMIRGVVFPYARAGIAAALILGLGRAIGEAIAVTQVIGNRIGIQASLLEPGDTLASRIAGQYVGAETALGVSSIIYLAVILLVFSLAANLIAQLIVRRVAKRTAGIVR